MSLQVWLPLNGSLKNLGLDGSATIAGTPAWGTNGKIGNNYLSTSNALTLTTNALKNTQIMSVSFWINLSDTAITSDWTRICLFRDGSSNLRIESCPSTSTNWRFLSVHNNTGNLMGGDGLISSDKNLLNKWTHVVYTYDNVYTHKAKAYINGVKTLDVTISGKTGKFTGSVNIENSNKFRINDFRIYSHALTETEVQEISKGLVAHYRLTGNGNPNLCSTLLTTGNKVTLTGQTYSYNANENYLLAKCTDATTSSGGFHYNIFPRTTDKSDKTFTWSCWMKANRNITLGTVGSEASGTRSCAITTKWKFFKHTWKYNGSTTYSSFVWYNPSGGWKVGDELYVKDVKVEEGTEATSFSPPSSHTKYTSMGYNSLIEEDCSGYGNKGTKKKIFTYDINSPMNESCYNFTGDNCVMCYRGGMVTDEITLSCWAYMTDWTKVTRLISCTEAGGWNLERNYNGINFALASTTHTYTTNTIIPIAKLTSGWHLISVTYDGLCKKAYVDGVLVTTTNLYSTKTSIKYNSSNGIFIGAEPASSQTSGEASYMPAGSKMSDVRIYATALTQDQITELYNLHNNKL